MADIREQFRINLQNEFSRRCRDNSKYSLRSFSNYLGVDSSTLSQIINGKRPISFKFILKLQDRLPEVYQKAIQADAKQSHYKVIEQDHFKIISDWYHFAIMDLAQLKLFKKDYSWIARRLELNILEVKLAVERLLRLGFIKESKFGYEKATPFYTNYEEGQTSPAHKEYQRQVLNLGLKAISEIPPELKDITSITIAGNSKKIAEVKALTKKFRREICQLMEDGHGDEVFHLAIQLYPVSKSKAQKKENQ